MHDAPREGRGRGVTNRGMHAWIRATERNRGIVGGVYGEWKEHEKGAEFPARRKAELKRVLEGRSDYLQQSKQDKLSVCISAWSGPITLFYPPGVICRFIGRTLDTLFRRYLWPRHGAARRSKVAECSGACIGSIEKSVTAYPAEASFVATRRVKSIYCGGHVISAIRKVVLVIIPNALWLYAAIISAGESIVFFRSILLVDVDLTI